MTTYRDKKVAENIVAVDYPHKGTHKQGGGDEVDATGLVGAGIDSGLVVSFDGLIADIPVGYVICDGNNGTVNRLTRFEKQVDTAITEAGTTGGSTAKSTASHQHADQLYNCGDGGAVNIKTASKAGLAITDIRPLYIDTLKLMKT